MSSKLVFVVLLAIVFTASAMVCPPDYCQRVDCINLDKNECEQNRNGVFRERGSLCGCCPTCLTKLNEGESCFVTLLRGTPPKAVCAPGLTCDRNTKKCVTNE